MCNGTIQLVLHTKELDDFLLEVRFANYLIICERIEVKSGLELDSLLDPLDVNIPNYLKPIFIFNEPGKELQSMRYLKLMIIKPQIYKPTT